VSSSPALNKTQQAAGDTLVVWAFQVGESRLFFAFGFVIAVVNDAHDPAY